MNLRICLAIRNRNLLEVYYEGGVRTIEPYAYGINRRGDEVLKAYQLEGYSLTETMGWKTFCMGKLRVVKFLLDAYESPRPEYRLNDSQLSKIFCQLCLKEEDRRNSRESYKVY